MKIIENLEQGTIEWQEARMCKVTGTSLKDVMGTRLAQVQLISRLIGEEGTEQVKIGRATAEMERGVAEEDFAIKMFEEKTGKKVDQVGFCISDDFDWLGLSPDGLIADENGEYTEAVEVKSPDTKTSVFYRLMNQIPEDELGLTASKKPFLGIPSEYKWQVVNNFIVNEKLKKLYFLVYDVRFIDEDLRLLHIEVERDNEILQEAIDEAKEALEAFSVDWSTYRDFIIPNNF